MNEEKFNGKAGIYAKYRPTYPTNFVDYLYSEVGLNKDSIIADITFILANMRLLKKSGSR